MSHATIVKCKECGRKTIGHIYGTPLISQVKTAIKSWNDELYIYNDE